MSQEPEQERCGSTHYAGCACHELGWRNRWEAAIEMASRAALERDELRTQIEFLIKQTNQTKPN
jgi:hypothetical protein